MNSDDLKTTLERFYRGFDFEKRIPHDPIEFPLRYAGAADREISGFISSCFAYGRVGLFKPVVEKLLGKMGRSPYEFLMSFNLRKREKTFDGIRYRFNRNEDIVGLLLILSETLKKYRSIENAFKESYLPGDSDIGSGLSGLVATLSRVDTSAVYGKNIKPPGLLQFFPSPINGGACKRSSLFLRWMIRDRDIDLGLWRDIPKNRLVIPLDTHIGRISRCIGLIRRRSLDWRAAVEITTALKEFDPEDPVKYDFALCHQGISGLCKGRKDGNCGDCDFSRLNGGG